MEDLNLNDFKKRIAEGDIIVDIRDPLEFSQSFIKGALSIAFTESFVDDFQELVDADQKVVLIADKDLGEEIIRKIKYAGVTNVTGYLVGGFEAWRNHDAAIDLVIAIDADEFAIDYQFDEFFLLDVRDKVAYQESHIEDSENIELLDLEPILIDLDANENYYIYADTAKTAITAASLFKRAGFERVRAVAAAYDEIIKTKIPVFTAKKKS